MTAEYLPLSVDEIRAALSPELLAQLRDVGAREAQSRLEAKERWAFAKAYLEPVIADASNDTSAKSFLPNHEFVLRSYSLAQLVVKCRKTAHSWGISAYAICQALMVPRSHIYIGSFDEKEARNKLEFLDWITSAIVKGSPSLRSELKMSDGSEQRRFPNGSVIHFLAHVAPTGAGGHFLGDEFSVEPKGRASASEILTGAIGAITHRGTIRLGGTQRGKDTLFYKLYSGEWMDELAKIPELAELLAAVAWEIGEFPWWSSPALCVDVPTAQSQAPLMETLARVTKFGNDKLKHEFGLYLGTPTLGMPLFQREFELTVVSDDEKFIEWEIIQMAYPKRDAPFYFKWCEVEGGNFYNDPGVIRPALNLLDELAGLLKRGQLQGDWGWAMDIGDQKDPDEILIGHNLAEDPYSLAPRAVLCLKHLPFEGKVAIVSHLLKVLPVTRGAIDATYGSLGVQLAQFFEVRFGQRARGVQFSNQKKQIWATGVKARLQQRKLLLPYTPHPDTPSSSEHFTKLRDQMLALKKHTSASGFVKFDVERNTKLAGHGDCFWALAMWNDLYPPLPDSSGQQVVIVGTNGRPLVGQNQAPRYGNSGAPKNRYNLPQRKVIR